jgi:hypothetical protein
MGIAVQVEGQLAVRQASLEAGYQSFKFDISFKWCYLYILINKLYTY